MTDAPKRERKLEPLGEAPRTEVRYLTPDMCRIHLGTHDTLHVTVPGEHIYGGVYAVYAFPAAYTDRYISLLHRVTQGKDVEIGVIRDLDAFSPEAVALVRAALARRYFIHTITRIHAIGLSYGFIAVDADTDKGHVNFMMKWQQDRAVDYGEAGKVLIDVDENRYLVPDVNALPAKELAEFKRMIYW